MSIQPDATSEPVEDITIADAEYARVLKEDPLLPNVWRLRSRIALQQDRNDDAIALLKEGMKNIPGQPDLMVDLANLYLLSRDPISARPLIEGILNQEGRQAAHVFSYGRLLWLEGAYEEATQVFGEAVTKAPGNKQFSLSLIQAFLSLEETPKAVELLRHCHDRCPWGQMTALLVLYEFDQAGIEVALDLLLEGLQQEPAELILNYLYAVLLLLSGYADKAWSWSSRILGNERFEASWNGFLFAREHGEHARFYGLDSILLTEIVDIAPRTGLVLEFGVYHGLSLGRLTKRIPGPIHGFDSFEGLPEDWTLAEPKGSYSTHGRVPKLPARVILHRGWFNETLPAFVAGQNEKLRLVHVDCDLYSSTCTVLEELRPLLQPGTILFFDEFLGFPGYEQHEFRAWQEFSERYGIKYEYAAFNLMAKKAAILILAI